KSFVYFENLSCEELGALLTALQLDDSQRHQIGMGKPYGLGSVKITPTFIVQDRKKRYESLFDGDESWSIPTKDLIEDCKRIFENKVLETYNSVADKTVSTFQQIPRLRELFIMLEWENASPSPKKKYRGLESDEDKKMWRNRYVLPSPSYVEGFSNSIVATTNNQTPNQSSRTPQEEKEAITRSLQHYQQAIESLTGGSKELKELAK